MEQRSPLRRLWDHAGPHRGRVRLAATFSVLNKVFDVAPELLIGIAVDVVVNNHQSLMGRLFHIDSRVDQLSLPAPIHIVVCVSQSAPDYVAHVLRR